jgi:hypothetical protein
MMKCKEFVHTISHDLEGEKQLTLRLKWSLFCHRLICIHCRRYVEHLKVLKTRLKEYYQLQNNEDHSVTVKSIEDKVINELLKKEESK